MRQDAATQGGAGSAIRTSDSHRDGVYLSPTSAVIATDVPVVEQLPAMNVEIQAVCLRYSRDVTICEPAMCVAFQAVLPLVALIHTIVAERA